MIIGSAGVHHGITADVRSPPQPQENSLCLLFRPAKVRPQTRIKIKYVNNNHQTNKFLLFAPRVAADYPCLLWQFLQSPHTPTSMVVCHKQSVASLGRKANRRLEWCIEGGWWATNRRCRFRGWQVDRWSEPLDWCIGVRKISSRSESCWARSFQRRQKEVTR